MVRPGDEVVLSWAPSCGECAGCRRGRPATCRPLNAAIPNGTLPDGTTRMSYRGETVYRGTATGCLADRVVVTEKVALPPRRCAPVRPGGAARLRRAHRGRRGALRGEGRARCVGGRDRRGRCRPVRRPGRADCRRLDDRRLRPRRRAARGGAQGGRDPRRGAGRPPGPDPLRAAGRRRLRVRRGGRSGDERDGAALHPRRGHHRDRRPAGAGPAPRPRPVRADSQGEAPHRARSTGPRTRRSRSPRCSTWSARAGSTSRRRSVRRSRSSGSTRPCRRAWRGKRGACSSCPEPTSGVSRRPSRPEATPRAPGRPPPGATTASGRARASRHRGRRRRACRSSPR